MIEVQKGVMAYSVDAAAKASHIGRTKLYEEIKAGRLKVRKFGRRTLITAEALSEWLNALPAMGE
jgi:excisionase family DNA binding protein